jgi:hypothetical protein
MELSDRFIFFRKGTHLCGLLADSVEGVESLAPETAPLSLPSTHGEDGEERTVLVAYEPGAEQGILIRSPEDLSTADGQGTPIQSTGSSPRGSALMKPPFPTAVPESAETGVERLCGKMGATLRLPPSGREEGRRLRAVLENGVRKRAFLPSNAFVAFWTLLPATTRSKNSRSGSLSVERSSSVRERPRRIRRRDLPDIATRKKRRHPPVDAGVQHGPKSPTRFPCSRATRFPAAAPGAFPSSVGHQSERPAKRPGRACSLSLSFRGMDDSMILLYFSPCGAERYSVRDVFRKKRLLRPAEPRRTSGFLWRDGARPDAIFCRNVLILYLAGKA